MIANQPLPTRNGAQDFFNGLLQDKSEEFLWKKGMVTEMNRLIFLRSLHQPKGQDNTEHEIVLPHVKLLCASFARAGTKEAAERKLAIKTLFNITTRDILTFKARKRRIVYLERHRYGWLING